MGKVGIIGHYGFGLDLANGQTIKTKIITEEIKNTKNKVITIDAHGGIKAIIPVILGCIKCLIKCDSVIIMLTENGLKVAVPVLTVLNLFFHKKLHYIVIGGWLPKFLKKEYLIKQQLKKFNYIYVETSTMKTALKKKGFTNVIIMPNCKKLQILKENSLVSNTQEPLLLCTFSRVMKEKGIETIVNVVKVINKQAGRIVYKLDIYGQIDSNQVQWFENLKESFPSYISYGGVIPYNNSVEILKNYFALIFPTHFYTEGIPGTIIDAYAAGVPVISSRWESFSDVVDEGKTGFGYEFDNKDMLKQKLISLSKDPQQMNNLKTNCIKKAREYTLEQAMKILVERL